MLTKTQTISKLRSTSAPRPE